VATPVRWEELARRDAAAYDVKTVVRRLARLRADPWADLVGARQHLDLRAAARLER
jgi:DNA primase